MDGCRHCQIIAILKQAEAGGPVPELCREHGISNATFYKWRAKYGGMDASLMARMKELEDENRRLKKMYAEERLKAEIVAEARTKKVVAPSQRREMAQWAVAQRSATINLNRTVRYDWLARHLFETLDEIQEFATHRLWTHNHDRPNMALGGITPKQKLALAA
jgi:putative transposase